MEVRDTTRPIVVGVEDKQRGALRYALEEADKFGCGIRVVHAYASPGTGVGVLFGNDLVRASEEEAQAIIDGSRDYIASAGSGANVEYSTQVGTPTRVLEFESLRARFIVLGPDDNAWYERLLVGEVSSQLVTHATCPVVVVPENWFPREARRGGIVVTIDGATDAYGPLTFAFAEAERREEELHVLHVVPAGTNEQDEEVFRANIAEVIAGWTDKYPTVRTFRALVFGDLNDVLSGATKLSNLVVVGRPRGLGLPFSPVRPVAVSIIKEADCPVAVVPPDYES